MDEKRPDLTNANEVLIKLGENLGIIDGLHGILYLTNKRLILHNSEKTLEYPLSDIKKVEFRPRMSDIPIIYFKVGENVHRLEVSTFIGGNWVVNTNFDYADNTAYGAYWASLLTLAIVQYGNPEPFKMLELKPDPQEEKKKPWWKL